jgi:biopolymer transport protein ExbD
MRALRDEDEAMDVPMTPLIDIVFLLLIFFLVATTFSRKEVDQQVALPSAEGGEADYKHKKVLVLNIRGDGTLVADGRVVEMDALRGVIGEWHGRNPGRPIAIRGDEDVAYGVVARVMGVCKALGVRQVDLPVRDPAAHSP